MEINMFIIGILGVIGIMMWAMILGGGLGPFIDMPSLAVVFGGSFFAGLAVSKGKINSQTISATGDAAVKIGWIGFLIGLVLMSGNLKDLLAKGNKNILIKTVMAKIDKPTLPNKSENLCKIRNNGLVII